jgi:multidrug efflux pump subunit AcrA (membrane-fusion protein)
MHRTACFALVAAATSLAAARSASRDTSAVKREEPARSQAGIPVTVGVVVRKAMPITTSVVGTVEAYSKVSVHAQITSELTSVNFRDGDDVHKGQVLMLYITPVYYVYIEGARASLSGRRRSVTVASDIAQVPRLQAKSPTRLHRA